MACAVSMEKSEPSERNAILLQGAVFTQYQTHTWGVRGAVTELDDFCVCVRSGGQCTNSTLQKWICRRNTLPETLTVANPKVE